MLSFSLFLISFDIQHQLPYFLIFLFKNRLHFSQLNLHLLDLSISRLQLLKTSFKTIGLESHFFPLNRQDLFVHGQQFKIRCRCDVVVSTELLLEINRIMLYTFMDIFEHLNQLRDLALDAQFSLVIN